MAACLRMWVCVFFKRWKSVSQEAFLINTKQESFQRKKIFRAFRHAFCSRVVQLEGTYEDH